MQCTKSAAISLVTKTQKILYIKYHQHQPLNRFVCVSGCVRGWVLMLKKWIMWKISDKMLMHNRWNIEGQNRVIANLFVILSVLCAVYVPVHTICNRLHWNILCYGNYNGLSEIPNYQYSTSPWLCTRLKSRFPHGLSGIVLEIKFRLQKLDKNIFKIKEEKWKNYGF